MVLKNYPIHKISLLLAGLFVTGLLLAQPGVFRSLGRGMPSMSKGTGGNDSLKHRTNLEDSITITFRYIDSARNYKFDSSVSDFTKRFPIPATHVFLGNTGAPTHSILFAPSLNVGWDPGFHALDAYKWKLQDVRFFNTTRPYTELSYLLGSKVEQIIEVQHTQNLKPYWNASFRYRLINSPGFFKNQKSNHNNYLLTSWYQAPKKRYNNFFIVLANSLQANESGGIDSMSYLKNLIYTDRFNIPTKIGGDAVFGTNFFSSNINTGNKYKELNIVMRQQYDFGQKDSIVTDSTVIPLFYPRLRLEHTLNFGKYNYQFIDRVAGDSAYYRENYNLPFPDSILLKDSWREISNDFSIYQFPDAKNLGQFIKAGIEYQSLHGTFASGSKGFYNFIGHGEYRNRTRNQKWDIEAFGSLYLNGYNAGDYNASISLQRLISPKIGSLQVGFQNANRSPSFIFDNHSSFYLDATSKSFLKENITHIYATAWQPRYKLQLSADYYLIGNYLYLTNFYNLQQENALFTVLRINALKTFKLARHWNWYSEVYLQQKTGNAAINFPLLYTRSRIALEGVFYKNLNLSTGIEIRYHSPYIADNFSPVLGQFFYQDMYQINNRPDIAAYLHFRIRSFKAYVRAENLNSFGFLSGSTTANNNLAAPGYPYPGFLMRFGFYWSFVN